MVGDFVDFGIELCFINLKRKRALLKSNLVAIRLMIIRNKAVGHFLLLFYYR